MKLTFNDRTGRYELRTVFEEKETAKKAGFRWDSERKIWWTKFEEKENAVRLYEAAEISIEKAGSRTRIGDWG